MSNETISLELEKRTVLGKQVRGLRNQGLVPAVIHDHGKTSLHVAAPYLKIYKVYTQAGKHHPVILTIDGKEHMALIKDVDMDPKKHQMRHVVFNAIKQDEKVEAEIPVVFDEDIEIPAEKVSLMVLKQLDHVEVQALPRDLPDEIKIDPSTLVDIGDRLTVADLKVPAGVEIITEPETQIAVVEMPKDQVAEADAAKAEMEAMEGAIDAEAAEGEAGEAGDTAEAADSTEASKTEGAKEEPDKKE